MSDEDMKVAFQRQYPLCPACHLPAVEVRVGKVEVTTAGMNRLSYVPSQNERRVRCEHGHWYGAVSGDLYPGPPPDEKKYVRIVL